MNKIITKTSKQWKFECDVVREASKCPECNNYTDEYHRDEKEFTDDDNNTTIRPILHCKCDNCGCEWAAFLDEGL